MSLYGSGAGSSSGGGGGQFEDLADDEPNLEMVRLFGDSKCSAVRQRGLIRFVGV